MAIPEDGTEFFAYFIGGGYADGLCLRVNGQPPQMAIPHPSNNDDTYYLYDLVHSMITPALSFYRYRTEAEGTRVRAVYAGQR